MKSKSLLRMLSLGMALALLVLAGCSSTKPTTPAPSGGGEAPKGDIIIGAALPTTGSSAKMGQDMSQAIQMAMDEINAAGGVLGRKLKLEVHDSACDAQAAVAAANKIVSIGAVAAVGSLGPADLAEIDRHLKPAGE